MLRVTLVHADVLSTDHEKVEQVRIHLDDGLVLQVKVAGPRDAGELRLKLLGRSDVDSFVIHPTSASELVLGVVP